MKTSKRGAILIAAGVLFASTVYSLAIEGLQVSVQCSNVVLSWPSTDGETYIVQYRPTLQVSTPWQTLTFSLPASVGTNLTFFVHSNIVQNPNCGGGSLAAMGDDSTGDTSANEFSFIDWSVPLAMPADGTGSIVALALYPPGFDLSDFLIFDPATSDWVKAADYFREAVTMDGPLDPEPMDGGGTNAVPETGFYRVVRNGVHFFGVLNGMVLSGRVEIPIEYSLSSTDQVTGISFYGNDGEPLVGASQRNDGSPWTMEWDTAMVANGTYTISAGVGFEDDIAVVGTPITVTVSNLVFFPIHLTRFFGYQMWVYAELSVLEADFEIDMYASQTNYIGTFAGSTSDGVISFLWDLTDGGSYTFTEETFMGVFNITPTGSRASGAEPMPADGPSSSKPATNFWAKEFVWSGEANFVVAWSRNSTIPQDAIKVNSMVASGVVDVLGARYTLSPGNPVNSDTAFQMADPYTKTNLLNFLWNINYRNFYFFGHGSPNHIGGVAGDPTINRTEMNRWLYNFFTTPQPTNYHPYRLVYIDACETGKGTYCEAFGMPAKTLSRAYFTTAGLRSRGFLGFKGDVTFNRFQWEARAERMANFFTDWAQRHLPLQQCVSNAVNFTIQPLDSSWVIYGATDLTYGLQ